MKKRIALLGSTGSIGTQTLDVVNEHRDRFEIKSLVAFSDKKSLLNQKREFGVDYAGLIDSRLRCDDGILDYGEDCLEKAVGCGVDVVVVATRGITALKAVLKAAENGIDIALANKECLVCGGALVKEAVRKGGARLLPVDSEHSAVWQCMGRGRVKNIVLTASGGPFFRFSEQELKTVTAEMALKHPTFRMGGKITVDSATLMNKGLEIIEAHWLFGLPLEKIRVVVHPQSIVHSLVEYEDGSMLAQLSRPDMRYAIQYALTYPEKLDSCAGELDLTAKPLEFFALDETKFKTVALAREAFAAHALMPTVLNAANDVCVYSFLEGRIGFCGIYDTVKKVVDYYKNRLEGIQFNVDGINRLDNEAKLVAANFLKGI